MHCAFCLLADIQNTPRRILTNVPAQHLYVRISQSAQETQRQVTMLRDISIKSIFIIANDENAKTFLEEVIYSTVQMNVTLRCLVRRGPNLGYACVRDLGTGCTKSAVL